MTAGLRPDRCFGRNAEQGARSIRIAIFDPYPIYRLGAVEAIKRSDGLLLVAEGATAAAAQRVTRELQPDILLMDISIPAGVETILAITRSCAICKIVALTAVDDVASISKSLAAGIKGYILKGISGADLIGALRVVHQGVPYITPELAARLLTEARGGALVQTREDKLRAALSYREEQMLDRMSKGLTNREIAEQLGLTVGTVKYYVTHLFKKLQVRNRIEALKRSSRDEHEPA